MVLFLLGLIFVTCPRFSRQSRIRVARVDMVTVWTGQADGLALGVATVSAFLFHTLHPFNHVKEKEWWKEDGLMNWGCRDTAIMQSMMERSRILKLRGAESQSCASSKWDQQLFIPQNWENSVISTDWLSNWILNLCILCFPGSISGPIAIVANHASSNGDQMSLWPLLSLLWSWLRCKSILHSHRSRSGASSTNVRQY